MADGEKFAETDHEVLEFSAAVIRVTSKQDGTSYTVGCNDPLCLTEAEPIRAATCIARLWPKLDSYSVRVRAAAFLLSCEDGKQFLSDIGFTTGDPPQACPET